MFLKILTKDRIRDFIFVPLSLLILVEPFNPENNEINFPLFILLYDIDNNLIDKQFFRFNGYLKYNQNQSSYQLTEVIDNLEIFVDSKKFVNSMTVGFVEID